MTYEERNTALFNKLMSNASWFFEIQEALAEINMATAELDELPDKIVWDKKAASGTVELLRALREYFENRVMEVVKDANYARISREVDDEVMAAEEKAIRALGIEVEKDMKDWEE